VAEANRAVAIVGAYGLRNEHVSWDGLPYGSTVVRGREICRTTLLGGPYVFGSPTSLLIRSQEVRKRPLFYNEENRHCDIESCLEILKDNDFGFVHQVLTFTRDHAESETTFSARFGTDYLGTLEHLTKYGRTFLSESEYAERLESCLENYYSFLADKVLGKTDNGFWDFQRKALGRLGHVMSHKRLATRLIAHVFDLVFNPLNTSRRIVRKIGRSSPFTTEPKPSKNLWRSSL
jgi:hypothetical protein